MGKAPDPTAAPRKLALQRELIAQLADALETARAAHTAAVEGAVHDEARAENDKDTRGLEQSYLARGQAERVSELEAAVAAVSALVVRDAGGAIGMGALVTADEDGETRRFFVAPAGGGNLLAGGVQVVTLASPLGRALRGKRVDDEVELRLPGKLRTLVVATVE